MSQTSNRVLTRTYGKQYTTYDDQQRAPNSLARVESADFCQQATRDDYSSDLLFISNCSELFPTLPLERKPSKYPLGFRFEIEFEILELSHGFTSNERGRVWWLGWRALGTSLMKGAI